MAAPIAPAPGGPRPAARFADGARDLMDLIVWLPTEVRRHIMAHTDTLTCLLHEELPRPVSNDVLRAAVADCFEHDRVDLARALLLPAGADSSEDENDGDDGDDANGAKAKGGAAPTAHPRAVVRLSMELLLVRSRAMRRVAARVPRPTGVGLFTAQDVAAAAAGRDTITGPSGLLNGLSHAVLCGDTARSRELAATARRVLEAVAAAGLTPERAGRTASVHWLVAAAALSDAATVRALLPHAAGAADALLAALDAAAMHGRAEIVELLCDACEREGGDAGAGPLAMHVFGDTLGIGRAAMSGAPPPQLAQALTLDGATVAGRVALAQQIRSRSPATLPTRTAITTALARRAADAVWWLLRGAADHRGVWRSAPFREIKNVAAEAGCVDVFMFAVQHRIGGEVSAWAFDWAAHNGHVEMLRVLHANCARRLGDGTGSRRGSIASIGSSSVGGESNADLDGHERIKLLSGGECALRGIVRAAENGHVEAFEFLWDHAVEASAGAFAGPPPSAMLAAARNGHLRVLESFVARTADRGASGAAPPPLDDALNVALEGGHVEIARMLVAAGRAVPSMRAMVAIARAGNLEAAQWLRSTVPAASAAPVPPAALRAACESGHAALAAFLIDDCGCKVTPAVRAVTAKLGHRAVAAVIAAR